MKWKSELVDDIYISRQNSNQNRKKERNASCPQPCQLPAMCFISNSSELSKTSKWNNPSQVYEVKLQAGPSVKESPPPCTWGLHKEYILQKRFKRLFRQIKSIWRLLRCWKGSFDASKCRFLSQPCPVRPSLWKLSLLTPLKMSSPNFKTRKEFLQISNVWCSLGHSSKTHWKMVAICPITTSKRNLLFTWYCVFVSTLGKKNISY